MTVGILFLPILILIVLALGVLVYYICYKAAINRKLRKEESGAHVPMASMESVFKVVVVIGVFVMYTSLRSKLLDLRSELRDTKSALSDKVFALQYELEEMKQAAKKEASMVSSAYYDFGEVDTKEHKVELKLFVSPKSYGEETEVSVVFQGEKIALTNDGRGMFSGSTIVPMFEDDYEKCMICITEGGVTKTEMWENAPQGSFYSECLSLLVLDGSMGSQSSRKTLQIDASYEIFPFYADSFHDVTLYVKKGGTVIDELDFVDGRVSIEQSYSLEKGEKGATIEFCVKGVDEYGYIHEDTVETWNIAEGMGNEAHVTFVNEGYRVYAPDGTLLTK